jgi:hypothetical protein
MSSYTPGPAADRYIKTTLFNAAHPRVSSPAVSRAAGAGALRLQFQNGGDFLNWQLSGLFMIPATGLPLTMFLYVSSQLDTAESVQLQVNKVAAAGKVTIFQTAVAVPAQGAVQIQFDLVALELPGQTVEVLLRSAEFLNIFQLFPSVNIVQTFPADGSTLPLLFVPPANFQQIFPVDEVNQPFQPGGVNNDLPPLSFTTGVLDVPQGVFAVRPLVQLELSSFFDETLTAEVQVNKLVRGTTTKELVLQETVAVPPHGARQLAIGSVEGLPVEVNLTLSRSAQGGTLQPAVNVANVFMVAEQINLVLFIPAGQFMGIFIPNTGATPFTGTAVRQLKRERGAIK